jgi:hypothetical protein
MLVILEAVSGPVAGRRIEVRAGNILRVGRTTRSDYAIGEDSYLSSQHFSVECDGAQCRVRDLGSSNGTFVNGNKISEQLVTEGDSLVAGGSMFTVHIEASPSQPTTAEMQALGKTAPTPIYTAIHTGVQPPKPAAPAAPAWPGFSRGQSLLLDTLYGKGEYVFAVLDCSRDSRIPAFLDASGERYLGIDPLARVQTCVVTPHPQSRLLDVMIKDGWGRGWCSYFTGQCSLEEACSHLSGYVTLYTQRGQPLTFRYWDPRVLRALVPQMSPEEAAAFWGPFTRIIVEGEKPETAIEISQSPRGPRPRNVALL